jgi:choline dehydrogenase-like flavoprotein
MALSEEVQRHEELVDVQIDLDPVYEQAYVDSLASENVESLKAVAKVFREWEAPDDFRQHLGNVLADLLSWQGYTFSAAPFPLPKPAVIEKVWQADPAERVGYIAEIFGDSSLAVYAELYGSVPIEYIQVTTRVEQTPNPDSRVTLMTERDPLGQNRVQLDWRLSPLDKYSIIRSLEILGAELGRAGLGRLQITLAENDPGWPDDLRGGWHHIGTTRMSEDPRQGVVDTNCQVHGVVNLFVAGSSVFSTSGSGTPTLTLVSLALRLADYLKERMR